MSDGHGGYRAPRNPAPASGPGKLSRRTDGGPAQKIMTPTGLPYGDAQTLTDQQHAAPLSQQPSVPSMPVNTGSPPDLVGLDAGTTRPDEPVTAGVDAGDGPGSEVLSPPQPAGAIAATLSRLSAADVSGELAALYRVAIQRGV